MSHALKFPSSPDRRRNSKRWSFLPEPGNFTITHPSATGQVTLDGNCLRLFLYQLGYFDCKSPKTKQNQKPGLNQSEDLFCMSLKKPTFHCSFLQLPDKVFRTFLGELHSPVLSGFICCSSRSSNLNKLRTPTKTRKSLLLPEATIKI